MVKCNFTKKIDGSYVDVYYEADKFDDLPAQVRKPFIPYNSLTVTFSDTVYDHYIGDMKESFAICSCASSPTKSVYLRDNEIHYDYNKSSSVYTNTEFKFSTIQEAIDTYLQMFPKAEIFRHHNHIPFKDMIIRTPYDMKVNLSSIGAASTFICSREDGAQYNPDMKLFKDDTAVSDEEIKNTYITIPKGFSYKVCYVQIPHKSSINLRNGGDVIDKVILCCMPTERDTALYINSWCVGHGYHWVFDDPAYDSYSYKFELLDYRPICIDLHKVNEVLTNPIYAGLTYDKFTFSPDTYKHIRYPELYDTESILFNKGKREIDENVLDETYVTSDVISGYSIPINRDILISLGISEGDLLNVSLTDDGKGLTIHKAN